MAGSDLTPPPLPPSNLNLLTPRVSGVSGDWYRITNRAHTSTVHFFSDFTSNRFSSPTAKHGVSYYGVSPEAAFAEYIRGDLIFRDKFFDLVALQVLDLHRIRISIEDVDAPDNQAIDLTGTGASAIRSRADCFTLGTPEGYEVSQTWARALMDHPTAHCGLIYMSNRAVDQCLGLYGEAGQCGDSYRKALGLNLDLMDSIPVLNSRAFRDWITACGYQIMRRPA